MSLSSNKGTQLTVAREAMVRKIMLEFFLDFFCDGCVVLFAVARGVVSSVLSTIAWLLKREAKVFVPGLRFPLCKKFSWVRITF
jgi:hypothetical protein